MSAQIAQPITDLQATLLSFSKNPIDAWRLEDAVRGTMILGTTGSGKTSGSGKSIALSMLKNGFGGVVLTAKQDEAQTWIDYAKIVGREDDIILFEENSPFFFNPLEYEASRSGKGAGETVNLVNIFMNTYKLLQRISGGEAKEGERFWDASLKRCLSRLIDLLKMAKEELSFQNFVEVLNSAPYADEVGEMANLSKDEFQQLLAKNYCIACVSEAGNFMDGDEVSEHTYKLVYNYWMRDFPRLPDNTRSTIVEMAMGLFDAFLTGVLHKHFAGTTNITPEMTHEGKIIILNFSVKEYLDLGVLAQGIFKMMFQQSCERRKIEQDSIPLFLWADEAQYFINEQDQLFATTSRSSKTAIVFLTQSISNLYAVMGGNDAKARVDALLGCMSTKIFHCNNDNVTNQWAANCIGKDLLEVDGFNLGASLDADAFSQNRSFRTTTKQLLHLTEPITYTTLKSGGPQNDFRVEAVITVAGRKWSNNANFIKVSFNQKV